MRTPRLGRDLVEISTLKGSYRLHRMSASSWGMTLAGRVLELPGLPTILQGHGVL